MMSKKQQTNSIALFTILTLFMMNAITGTPVKAQPTERTAQLVIANNTNATIHVEIVRKSRSSTRFDWENKKVTLPPITEKTVTVPAGFIRIIANAYRASPAKGYEDEFALSAGGKFTYNITPQKFGTSFISDRPKKGLAINDSKVILNGAQACRQSSWDEAMQWYISGAGGSSPYYETSSYLCRENTTGFFLKGSPYRFYRCNKGFEKCYRVASYNANRGKALHKSGEKQIYEFIWESGGRVDKLSQN